MDVQSLGCICIIGFTFDKLDPSVCGKELEAGSLNVQDWYRVESILYKM